MKKIALILLLSCVQSLIGQKAYFFNDHNFIGYSSNFLHFSDIGRISENQHHLSYQRMLSRRKMLVLDYGFSKNKLKFYLGNQPKFKLEIQDTLGDITQYNLIPTGIGYIRTQFYSIGLRNYIKKKGAIAPYGPFIDYRVGFAQMKYRKSDDHVLFNTGNDLYLSDELPLLGINHLNMLSIQIGCGASRQITKNLYFDWLFSFKLNNALWYSRTHESKVYHRDYYYFRTARKVYLNNNTLGITLGIHYGF